jgi:translation initiation factor IF-3
VSGRAAAFNSIRRITESQGGLDIGLRPRGRQPFRDPRREQALVNERIRFPQVRVIDDQNAQIGIISTREALDIARDRGLDLIVVAPQAQPPVCRIMDYGKFKYEKSKREKEAHKKSAATEMKMVRLHPRTSEHDREVLVRNSERFLRGGHKVRVVCRFQGRENAHPEIGRAQLEAVSGALAAIATVEGPVIKQGRDMLMNLAPKPGLKVLPKAPKGEPGKADRDAQAAAVTDEVEPDAEFVALQEALMRDDEDDVDEAGQPELSEEYPIGDSINGTSANGVIADGTITDNATINNGDRET